ncbi:TIGR03619 family F420-dependent LLM class oxidoreductase [Mycobacterium sp. MS1601]|uniref:TIGR03619 family F420-dependent LLM class oxidoreductase n=1 Tax=Mycobacterium sp. MS1601 TaxID=1936029 RepID=UPI00178CA97C|nr:TIGR03619 family F420-dependent LLM class oxidoreductase [Mycobacterium sp. MS1601]
MAIMIGAKLPHTAETVTAGRVPEAAILLERAGFESLWVSDHIVLPRTVGSHYPFERDGVARWRTDVPYLEALTTLAAAAAVTTTVRLGTAVLVLPIRNPLLLAKQTAGIAALAPGRLRLGVGAGWLREEFDALGATFETRGAATADGIRRLRECWTGTPGDLLMLPAASIPIYPGGHSPAALRRAGRLGDGWLGQQSLATLDPAALAADIAAVRAAAAVPDQLHIVVRIVESSGKARQLAEMLPELAVAGVHEIIVDSDPFGDPGADVQTLRARAG